MSVTRRQAVVVLAAAGVLGPVSAWLASTDLGTAANEGAFPVQKTDAEWRAALTSDRYRILRGRSTERAFSSPLNKEKRSGIFLCAACGQQLFSSSTKFESGTGWPSFFEPIPGHVLTKRDFKLILPRTEYHCARCGGHQGHVFDDGPAPTGQRWCNNGVALNFVPD